MLGVIASVCMLPYLRTELERNQLCTMEQRPTVSLFGLSELPEMHFQFPFNMTGKLAMDLLTSPSLCVLKSWYAGGGPKQGFQCCFADGLNQRVVLSVAQATFFLI